MNYTIILAQCFGIAGMVLAILSFQAKKNSRFFVMQGLSGLGFALNFLMIAAFPGCAMNIVNIIRGALFAKGAQKKCKLIILEFLYAASVIISLVLYSNDALGVFLSLLTLAAQLSNTFVMWKGNGKHIRYIQFALVSPAWLAYDIVNFSLGGILCETFNMLSVVVSFVRYGKDGFEK